MAGMNYDYGMGYGSGMKGKKGSTTQNQTYSGMNDTMPKSTASFNGYGLSSGKITRRSAK